MLLSANTVNETIYAAGAVCWRIIEGRPHILVIHRPHRKDVSLPKGKVDPGESLPETAVREIREETGLTVTLGVPLGCTAYRLPSGRPKEVYYWAAQVSEKAILASNFVPNDEVEALEWLTPKRARRHLSYSHDVAIVEEFARIARQQALGTFALVLLRHAKAVPASAWEGRDSTRKLTKRGSDEATAAARALTAWRPRRLISSPAKRCRATITPLATLLTKPVRLAEDISQEAHERGDGDIRSLIGKRVRARTTAVLCTHRPVIPEILREIALATATPIGASFEETPALPTGGFMVIHLSTEHPGSGIVALETHAPLS